MTGSVVEQLLAMRAQLCRFNTERGLRTAIWYSSGWFLQWHEGSAAAVVQAWQLSLADRGHGLHRVIHRSEGAPGLVDHLHLCTAHNRDTPQDVDRRIRRVERERELGWSAEPAEIWQQLSAPFHAAATGAQAAVAAVVRGNVVAVTSEFTASVDLVKAIAEHESADITYQRFADGDLRGGDIGAAYVDVAEGGHTTRVQALSRRALNNSMVRLSLKQMQCLVLLLGDRPDPAARLAAAVVAMLEGMEVRPVVRLMGPSREACEVAAATLARLPGLDVSEREAGTQRQTRIGAMLAVLEELQQAPAEFVESPVSDLS